MIHRILNHFHRHPRHAMEVVIGLILVIGYCDYLEGCDVSLLVLYLIPILFATWFVGKRFGVIAALFSIAAWSFSNDFAAGFGVRNPLISSWNILSASMFFMLVIVLLSILRSLEAQVSERTLALQQEMLQRQKLEKEILEICEKEQRRIGYDLHDIVCQYLTGTKIALEMHHRQLAERGDASAPNVKDMAAHLVKAIELTRDLSKGLSPVATTPEGFMDALHQLADKVSRQHGITCAFDYHDPILIPDVTTATHLFLIVQEAVMNAVKHSGASRISIRLITDLNFVQLEISDNGQGLPSEKNHSGMGLHIMTHRAAMINARIVMQNGSGQGTIVRCILPKVGVPAQGN